MSIRLDRLLSIVIKLLSYKRLTTQQLAREFNVSTRTIYRDLQSISLAGIPVMAFQGQQGGWEIDPDYLIDRRILSVDDIATIVSAVQNVEKGISHPSLRQTIDKINSLIHPNKRKEITQKSHYIFIDNQPWGQSGNKDLISEIHNAIYDSKLLSFQYFNLKKERKKRLVEPMTLMLKGSAWYLFAYCLDRHDYRLFRLSRMSKITISKESFIRRDMSIPEFKKRSHWPQELVTLQVRFHKDIQHSIGDCFGLEHIHMEKGGNYGTLEVTIPENDWLYSLLLGFGEKLEVQGPKRIADILKQNAQALIDLYS